MHVHALILILTHCLEAVAAVGTRRSSAAVPTREGREIADYGVPVGPGCRANGVVLCARSSVVGSPATRWHETSNQHIETLIVGAGQASLS